ncbi:hypothetical protein BGZ60DRAFT_427761 [Tricladium varicosporioides]|nr:hypothetical protein BGZ60DRAFT_427761 [Hymenoscyphus varicosporioides]
MFVIGGNSRLVEVFICIYGSFGDEILESWVAARGGTFMQCHNRMEPTQSRIVRCALQAMKKAWYLLEPQATISDKGRDGLQTCIHIIVSGTGTAWHRPVSRSVGLFPGGWQIITGSKRDLHETNDENQSFHGQGREEGKKRSVDVGLGCFETRLRC